MLSFCFNYFLCVKTDAIIAKLHQQVLSTGKGVFQDKLGPYPRLAKQTSHGS